MHFPKSVTQSVNKMSEAILQIKYEGERINLSDLAQSIKALEEHYIFCTKSPKSNLYVKKVSEGSIVFEICENIEQILPMIVPNLQDYTFFLVNTIDGLIGLKAKNTLNEYYKNLNPSIKNFKKLLIFLSFAGGITAGGMTDASLTIELHVGDKINNNYYNSNKIQIAGEGCVKKIKEHENLEPTQFVRKNVELVFSHNRNQFIFKNENNIMGIVSSESKTPKQILFKDDDIEKRILKGNRDIFLYKYIVDIEVLAKEYLPNKKILSYKILCVHGEFEIPSPSEEGR